MANDPDQQTSQDLAARIQKARSSIEPQTGGDNATRAAKGSNTGYELVGTILVCTFIGWVIDRYLHTSPWGILGMLAVGFVAGIMNVWRALNGYDQSVGLHKKDGE